MSAKTARDLETELRAEAARLKAELDAVQTVLKALSPNGKRKKT